MKNRKVKMLAVIVGLIIFLSGGFIVLDWSRFFTYSAGMINHDYLYARYAKIMVSFLCSVIAWIAGKDSIDNIDSMKMKVAFAAIFTADVLLFLKLSLPGLAVFGMAQLLLAIRNGRGLLKFFKNGRASDNIIKISASGIIIAIMVLVLLLLVFYPILNNSIHFYFIAGYSVLISISLWVALMNSIIGYYEKANSYLLASGMILFFLCDMNVGLTIALEPGIYRLAANSIIWIFYTPALTMLALSAYDFEKMRNPSALASE